MSDILVGPPEGLSRTFYAPEVGFGSVLGQFDAEHRLIARTVVVFEDQPDIHHVSYKESPRLKADNYAGMLAIPGAAKAMVENGIHKAGLEESRSNTAL